MDFAVDADFPGHKIFLCLLRFLAAKPAFVAIRGSPDLVLNSLREPARLILWHLAFSIQP